MQRFPAVDDSAAPDGHLMIRNDLDLDALRRRFAAASATTMALIEDSRLLMERRERLTRQKVEVLREIATLAVDFSSGMHDPEPER
jgi:hypothetical protein